METYIIHNEQTTERKNLVAELQKKTGATIFPAIMMSNRVEGCHASHKEIYIQSKEDILIFEDDCEIVSENFLEPIIFKDQYSLIYLGVNKNISFGSYGSHAMWISKFAKDCFIKHNQPITIGVDIAWNNVEQYYKLKTYRPDPVNKYVQQKKGLRSLITGRIRYS